MADLISYRLTNANDSRLVSLVVNGVETRLLFSESEADQTLWADYQTWLQQGNEPAAAPVARVYPPATIEQKLERAGLTVDSLKTVLGLN